MSTGVTTPVTAASLRPFSLSYGEIEHILLVPTGLYSICTQLRDRFVRQIGEREFYGPVDLVAEFLGYVSQIVEDEPGSYENILPIILLEFESRFLLGNDVHTLAASLPIENPNAIVRSYLLARQVANKPMRAHASALLRAVEDGDAIINVIFGGQGNSEDYFDELRDIVYTYTGMVTPFVEWASKLLCNLVENRTDAKKVYTEGLNPWRWIRQPETTPSNEYLVFAPVSVPLIGAIQLAHYLVTCKVLGLTPGSFRQYLSGATGHSQGVITALAIASCNTWEEFYESSRKALTTLFHIGYNVQLAYPDTALLPSALQDSLDNNEGSPSPMLSVKDITLKQLQGFVDQTNTYLPDDKKISISLVNSPRSFVVSGPPMSLYGLNRTLRTVKGERNADEGRIPYSQRKLKINNKFLPITSPFHCSLLASVTDTIVAESEKSNSCFTSSEIKIPVYDTFDGSDLRELSSGFSHRYIDIITRLPVMWEKATRFPNTTHILDFGPGGPTGLALITHRNKEGTGVRVIVAGSLDGNPVYDELGYKQEIFNRDASSVTYASNWVKEYSPKLVKTRAGQVFVETKFSRLLGRPPVMVAAMTPTTANSHSVSATLNAGYHCELGGGGFFETTRLQKVLDEIRQFTSPAVGITINVLYVNPFMLQWCIPFIKNLRERNFPIEGLTVGAGVPSLEVANEYIRELGLKHISFKPGTIESIKLAVKIAAANPTFPVIIQWTGGRGGGHHSFEDFHQPILATYSLIRKYNNIILIAGSGFGDAESTYPYLTGEWSTRFDYSPMPFDGFLMGSRTMVAKEFFTAPDAKKAIVEAPGVSDEEWELTYQKPTGGVITVLSEMGEPIHKLATRGVLLWKNLDNTIFSLPRNKRVAALLARKAELIERLNKDYQKPWFCMKASGEAVDLEDMTYAEILRRMVDLMYVSSEPSHWIDVSLRDMTAEFVYRVEERLTSETGRLSTLQSLKQLEDPYAFLDRLFEEYPQAKMQIINAIDKDFFLMLCLAKNHKPVPFIPVFDENFEYYFKKDSLWQCENLDAVLDHDVGRTCILQGPVATRYATKVDEPIKDIMDSVHMGHVERLLRDKYENNMSNVPVVEYFGGIIPGAAAQDIESCASVKVIHGSHLTYCIEEGDLPSQSDWLSALAGTRRNWRFALLSSERIEQGGLHTYNVLRDVFKPVTGMRVEIDKPNTPEETVVKLFDHGKLIGRISYEKHIEVRLREHRTCDGVPRDLILRYKYDPTTGYMPISEIMENRNEIIKNFYWQVWFGGNEPAPDMPINEPWVTQTIKVDKNEVKAFVHAIGNKNEAYVERPGKRLAAPMDFAIVVGWRAIIKAIFPKKIDGDLLRLVHLSNGFKMRPGAAPLQVDDVITVTARINSVSITPSGKMIEVLGVLNRHDEPVMDVTSRFLFRGEFSDYHTTFKVQDEIPMELTLNTPKEVALLQSKEWFHPSGNLKDPLGKTLTVRCKSIYRNKSKDVYEQIETTGNLVHVLPTKEVVEVGRIEYTAGESYGNPVVDYLQRNGKPIEQPVAFENPIRLTSEPIMLRAPASNEQYAQVSGDFNPIHVSRAFASYVGLPGTITHGMHTSASVRAHVETWAAETHIQRLRAYSCEFVGMILPNDTLELRLEHVGMINGRKIIKIKVSRRDTEEIVLLGEAEIEQPTTTYLFTGQGSQEQGMGMDLYASSEVAREVWDRADKHFISTYGISILNIVRNNPPELTVYFGGEQGKRIRDNYIAMMFETVNEKGELQSERIFKSIDENTDRYTFRSDSGVLSMTQFTQPALTLMEKASFEDMKSRGLVDSSSPFAGHSLGEYSALASMAEVMPVESLVDVVFYRGMTMQVAVPRDSLGRSNYGMIAVNPSRVSSSFSEEALKFVVGEVAQKSGWLVEIVNYNVKNQQYVAAGDLRALDTLSNVLNYVKLKKFDLDQLLQQLTLEKVKSYLADIIEEMSKRALKKPQPIELERGYATIPLPGISVPFHSSYLRSGVNPFKTFLSKRVAKNAVKPASLVGKYIPNLTAKPFEITKEYFEEVYELTKSHQIKDILDRWDEITA